MRLEYPYEVERDERGFWLARCPGVRGAATDDRDRDVAVSELRDALAAAVEGYLEEGCPLPVPGIPTVPGQVVPVEIAPGTPSPAWGPSHRDADSFPGKGTS